MTHKIDMTGAHNTTGQDNTGAHRDKAITTTVLRKPWNRPNLRRLLAAQAEVFTSFHADGQFTAS
jgi:hypothetical protein